MTQFRNLSLDDTLGGNSPSDYVIPSQKAIKTYVDNNALTTSDIVSSVSSSSDNTKAVGAKLFYDTCGDIETLINAL